MANFLDLLWLGCILPLWATYLLLSHWPEKVSDVVVSAFLYGKLSKNNQKASLLKNIAIPKSWFRHFYQFAVVLFTMWTLLLLSWTLTGFRSLPSVLETSLNIFVPDRSAAVPLSVAIWVQILTTFQVFRRCYECMFLSVYSDAKMHVWHYAVGYIFYTGVQYSILSMALPSTATELANLPLSLGALFAPRVALGTAVFAAAFWLEFDTAKRFANMRKDKTGKVVSSQHSMPTGGMFELISCPHYFAEIMVYTGLTIVFGTTNLTWFLAVLWTYVNQIAVALLSHSWYQNNFKTYPSSRKAVIPFVL